MSTDSRQLYEFEHFRLDPVKRQLLRDGAPVPVNSKAFETLLALVESGGRVMEKDELMSRVWPGTVVEENNLNQCITTLRKTLGDSPQERRYIVTVPGRGYSFVAPVRQVAEVAEPTPEARPKPQAPASMKWLAIGALAVGLAAVGVALWIKSRSPGPEIRSIAVLPFKPLAAAQEDSDYLGLGIADALITRLSNVRQAVVRPTSAVARYAEPGLDPIAAGRALRVDAVLEGKIQKLGDRIRVTVQLLRVRDGAPLWAEQFDADSKDLFALQDSISQQVLQALTVKLTGEERRRLAKTHTRNPEAYQAYVKGRFHWSKQTGENLRRAIEYFQQAIEKDPEYALAYAGLADCFVFGGGLSQPLRDRVPKARAAADKALQLDDTLAEAYAPLAYIRMSFDWDWPGAEKLFRRAIELNPGYAVAHQYYGEGLAFQGRMPEAATEIQKAQELDPLSPAINTAAARIFYYARDYDRAIAQCAKAMEIDPNFVQAHIVLGRAYEEKGMLDRAISTFEKAANLGGDRPGVLASLGHAYALAGKKAEARQAIEQLQQIGERRHVSPFLFATVYAGLGEKEPALASLEAACELRESATRGLKVDPRLDGLRSEPRFQQLLVKVGLQ